MFFFLHRNRHNSEPEPASSSTNTAWPEADSRETRRHGNKCPGEPGAAKHMGSVKVLFWAAQDEGSRPASSSMRCPLCHAIFQPKWSNLLLFTCLFGFLQQNELFQKERGIRDPHMACSRLGGSSKQADHSIVNPPMKSKQSIHFPLQIGFARKMDVNTFCSLLKRHLWHGINTKTTLKKAMLVSKENKK